MRITKLTIGTKLHFANSVWRINKIDGNLIWFKHTSSWGQVTTTNGCLPLSSFDINWDKIEVGHLNKTCR